MLDKETEERSKGWWQIYGAHDRCLYVYTHMLYEQIRGFAAAREGPNSEAELAPRSIAGLAA